jgi:hypothetical protein
MTIADPRAPDERLAGSGAAASGWPESPPDRISG